METGFESVRSTEFMLLLIHLAVLLSRIGASFADINERWRIDRDHHRNIFPCECGRHRHESAECRWRCVVWWVGEWILPAGLVNMDVGRSKWPML